MKTNFGSGKVKIGYNTYPIIWTGEHAEHIAENYFIEKGDHIMLHKEIQQCLSGSVILKRSGTNRKYFGLYEHKSYNCIIFTAFLLNSSFVSITTSYKMGGEINMAIKQKRGQSITGNLQTFTMNDDTLKRVMRDLEIDDPEKAQSFMSRAVSYLKWNQKRLDKVITLKV